MIGQEEVIKEFIDQYQIVKQLGSGYQAIVYLALDPKGNEVAIKKFKRMPLPDSNVEEELKVMQELHHDNLIKLISVRPGAIYTNKHQQKIKCFAFVLEYAEGGELFDFVADTGRFSERVARTYFHQMMNGIHYMHEKGYAHRDIKPENLLLSGTFVLKIADFGFSCLLKGRDGSGMLKTKLGTEGYMAPEIFLREYQGRRVDVFAAGVILFIMYSGNPPFEKASPNDPYYRLIKENKLEAFWQSHSRKRKPGFYSPTFRDLFQTMVAFEPKDRPTIFQIAKHPWVKSPICTHSEIIKEFKERRYKLQEILEARRKAERNQTSMKNQSANSTESTLIQDTAHLSFLEIYQRQALQEHLWKDFSHTHQPDIIVENKDPLYVLCKLKKFLPAQTISLNLTHQEEDQEDEEASGDLCAREILDHGNRLHVTYVYSSTIHNRSVSHCLGMQLEVGVNEEGRAVIHFEPESNHLYFKLIFSNIKKECFA